MNFIKATIATAAVTVCCMGNAMPANANKAVRSANKFCSSLVEMNRTLGMSVAPGSTGAQMFIAYAGNDFNGFSYADLYRMSKQLGTSPDCRRVY